MIISQIASPPCHAVLPPSPPAAAPPIAPPPRPPPLRPVLPPVLTPLLSPVSTPLLRPAPATGARRRARSRTFDQQEYVTAPAPTYFSAIRPRAHTFDMSSLQATRRPFERSTQRLLDGGDSDLEECIAPVAPAGFTRLAATPVAAPSSPCLRRAAPTRLAAPQVTETPLPTPPQRSAHHAPAAPSPWWWPPRHALNVLNVAARVLAAAGTTTLLRELFGQAAQHNLEQQEVEQDLRAWISIGFGCLPIVLNVAGAVRDASQRRMTPQAGIARGVNIVTGAAALMYAGQRGILPLLAVPLAANSLYCLARDALQTVFGISNNSGRLNPPALAPLINGVCYAVNQSLVGAAFLQYAAPSGGAAASAPMNTVLANAARRAALNAIGETVDSTLYEYLGDRLAPCREKNPPLRLRATAQWPSAEQFATGMLSTSAARCSLFTTATLTAALAQDLLAGLPALGVPAAVWEIVASSGTLGMLYTTFPATHWQANASHRQRLDVEQPVAASRSIPTDTPALTQRNAVST